MPPKKDKDRTDDTYWRSYIEESPLNEELWQAKVMLFEIAGGEQEIIYLNRFETYAKEEKRFVVKNICKSETIFMINQLGADKKVRDDNLRVFEEGYLFLKDKKDIPPDILALIIKHLILKMKEEYISIQRQKLVVREGMRNESMVMIDRLEIKNNVPNQVVEPPPTETIQSKSKGKKGEGETQYNPPQPEEGKKYNTLLRERGEEWRDKVYVDDYPLDGPNLYVAITGFLEPHLLENLIKIGVPLTALVQIRISPVSSVISSGYLTGTKRGHSATELAADKAHIFWETLQQLRLNKETANIYNDMAFTVFTPPYNNEEALSSSSERIYDELSFLMYDIQDLTRQHSHYLNNMDVKVIPTETENSDLFKLYQNGIDIIPLECVTIFTIIDNMLQTIDTEYTDNVKNSRSSLSTAETLIQQSTMSYDAVDKAESLVDKVFKVLSKNDLDKKKYQLTCGELYDKFENPVIINYGDSVKLINFHLENINIDDFVLSSLINMPFCNLWRNQKILSDEVKAKANFHISNLISCFEKDDLDDSLLDRLIHILSFRKLYNNRSSLRDDTIQSSTIDEFKKVYLKRSMFAEPLLKSGSFCNSNATTPSSPFTLKSVDSYCKEFSNEFETEEAAIKYLFSCPDLSELVSAVEILNNKPLSHFIDEFDYFEEFTGTNALQILFEAFGKYNCLNYKYSEVTDSFEIMFFNDHNDDGISYNEWRCHLPTPVCLQDFYDFVFEEQYEWIREEEKIYDEITALKTKLEWKESLDQVPAKMCIDNIDDIDSELLIIGSLKYQERFQSDYISNEEIDQSPGKSPVSSPQTEPDTKSINKAKLPKNQDNKKQMKEVIIEVNEDIISDNIQCNKPFFGYDLGNRRVEVFGRDSVYFGKDGSKVSSFYTITIPMNLENLILKVTLGNGDTEFCMHRMFGDTNSVNYALNPESFRIQSKDRVIMYLRKNFYQVPIEAITTPPLRKPNVKESLNKINVKQSNSTNVEATFRKSYNSFIITWPNGLIIESIHESNSPVISHIKQYFISHPQYISEDMRCVTLHGEVIVFKKSGCIEVFRADGTFINITKCLKKAIYSEVTEDIQSNASSDKGKSKKGKGNKSKEKLKGTTSKSSKSTLDQNPVPEIPIQYELAIDEFEIIDGKGLKQKWINGHLVSTENVLIRTAVDYTLGEVLSRRMDGTSMLLNKDGVQVTTFHDNTRIITTCSVEDEEVYAELIESDNFINESNTVGSNRASNISLSQKSQASVANSLRSDKTLHIEEKAVEAEKNRADGFVSVQIVHTVEHSNFATVVIDKAKGTIVVESANKANLTIDNANNFNFCLDESTSATFNGKYLDIVCKACHLCHSCSKFKIKIDDTKSNNDISPYWLNLRDSFGKNIVVDDEGGINLVEEPYKEEAYDEKGKMDKKKISETCLTLQRKCKELYEANSFRFFVFNRNLTCSELVHRMLVDDYKLQCRWQPWCSINEYDTFGDHRTLISILTPIHLTETEKWLMKSKYSNKPKQLKYKDLKVDAGKGFYHWMRPYERFKPQPMEVENIEFPRLPRAYVLRTLELLWNAEVREKLKGGKELVAAVLRYRHLMESDSKAIMTVPIRDPRAQSEISADDKLQDVAERIYNDLKNRVADDIQAGVQPTITTEASSRPQYLIGDGGEVTCEELKKNWEEKSAAYIKEVEETEKASPNLERYWRRRAEEAKEEEFYRQLLREESIPPYFRNILGGAAWSEVNGMAGDAVTRSQAGPCICVKPDTETEPMDVHSAEFQ